MKGGDKAPGMLAWRRERFQKRKARCRGRGNVVLASETQYLAQTNTFHLTPVMLTRESKTCPRLEVGRLVLEEPATLHRNLARAA